MSETPPVVVKKLNDLEKEFDVEEVVKLGEHKLRIIVAILLVVLLILLNGAVVTFVWWAAAAQNALIESGKQVAAPLVTSHVIMSLVGATVVQAGTAFLGMTKYLFPAMKGGD